MTKKLRKAPVRQAVQELRDFYHLGQEVLEADRKNPRKGTYSLGVTMEFAERIGTSRDYIDKARKFAQSYSNREFQQLCKLRREQDGMPLGRCHMIALLRIKNKRQREKFQREAAANDWSTRVLTREISKLLGTGSSGGRKSVIAANVEDALDQINTMTKRWERWYAGYDSAKGKAESKERQLLAEDLPDPVGKLLKSASKQIAKLKKAVQEEMETASKRRRS